MTAKIKAICISERKGVKKRPVPSAVLMEDHGIIGDAHAGNWHRQISLLADESVDKMRVNLPELSAGDFAENILTEGITLRTLPIGTMLDIGSAVIEITQIGKECHSECEIRRITGMCVMPTDGVFAKVLRGGTIYPGDTITVRGESDEADQND